jgi:hypothetical protein
VSYSLQDKPAFPKLAQRWCSIDDLQPLFDIDGVEFFSVRKGMQDAELEKLKAETRIRHIGDDFENYADTAAVLELMDVVITTDGSVAHLASALGRATWIMLHDDPCWIWFAPRPRSPWYKSAHLFHQMRAGHWAPIIDRVAVELSALAAQRRQQVVPNGGQQQEQDAPFVVSKISVRGDALGSE